MVPYILIVDDESDILEIHEMSVRAVFSGDLITANSGNMALEVIQKHGIPRLIISDYRMADGDGIFLLNTLLDKSITVPFILCSGNILTDVKPNLSNVHIISKPNIVNPLIELLESILLEESSPTFVPVKISVILKMNHNDFDYYVKLSESNFIKAINRGEPVTQADGERFTRKSIHELYLPGQDALRFIHQYDLFLQKEYLAVNKSMEGIKISYEAIECAELLSRSLGWPAESIELAKKTVDMAIKSISEETELLSLLKIKLNPLSKSYSHHVATLALMTTALCSQMGWTNESCQMKLAMASILHDLTIDIEVYDDLKMWNQKASDLSDNSEKTVKYRNHPVEAVNIINKMKNLPPDIDNIILNHHENATMSGFPRKIIASRISHMTAIFIIMEDLIEQVEGEDTKAAILKFIRENEQHYSVGRFKSIFGVLKKTFEKQLQLSCP